MSERDCVLPMDGWIRNRVNEDKELLVKLGPLLKVRLRIGFGQMVEAFAIIDTASEHTRICADIARKLTGTANPPASGEMNCTLTFHNGTQMMIAAKVDSTLARPNEVAIGRDLLKHMRLVVDFTTGAWEFHINRGG